MSPTGQVDTAILAVGANDFRGVFTSTDSVAELQLVPTRLLTNVGIAAQAILGADPNAKLVITNVPNVCCTPAVRDAIDAGMVPRPFADAVSGTIALYDAALAQTFAGNERVAIADYRGMLESLVSPASPYPFLETCQSGVEGWHLWADSVHPGTFGQCLASNLIIDSLDERWGYGIARFSSEEISAIAGIPEPAGTLGIVFIVAMRRCVARRNSRH